MIARAEATPRQLVEIAELCIHEAAHAVAGVVLGGQLRAATVTGGERFGVISGRTTFNMLPPGRENEVAYAGCWAQARFRHGRTPTCREIWALLDTTGCQDAPLLAAGGSPAAVGVVPLLTRCWPGIVKLSRVINAEFVARHADACAALSLSRDDEIARLELAHIRGGAAPGSFRVTRPGTGL